MTILNIEDSLILMIDIQEKLISAAFNSEEIKKNSVIISKAANILNIPMIITEQYPKGLGNTISEIERGSNKVFEKQSFSALDSAEILDAIKSSNKKQIIIFGIETHICVSQTAVSLKNAGFEVFLCKNASGSRNIEEHLSGIERMKGDNIEVLTTEIALFEWLKTAKHPNFKEVQMLIK